ncbi:MAG TPA: fibronectin type III domain-containing protein [Bryobacteraceae bacterium]|nr:fibronectin type III domain-containing protein [Bryobacteraceae bacterium]
MRLWLFLLCGGILETRELMASSSTIRVQWAPVEFADHYRVVATDGRSAVVSTHFGPEALIEELKSATDYTIRVTACLDAECLESADVPEMKASTEAEVWRIVGSGNSFDGAQRLVQDVNVNASILRYGEWAGPPLAGKVQLYYVPLQGDEKGAKIGQLATERAGSIEAVSRFLPVSGYGLLRACGPSPCPAGVNLGAQVALFQPVPMANGAVRLFFEAQGHDGRTRILSLDSQDGYVGRDFHRGAPTRCSTFADYAPGGGCEPALEIDVNEYVPNARQFKMGWPNRDAALWDAAPGTWMWFTTEYQDRRCSEWGFNFAYAVWDGERWVVQYREDGCPKLMIGSQAMAPMHLGGTRYKMYFNHHQSLRPVPGQGMLKPMRVIYSDAGLTGDTATVDFEDWEPRELSRPVQLQFPDGTPLSEAESSRLDDTFVYMPGGDPWFQVMYTNMSSPGAGPPFVGTAILMNP